MSASLKVLKSAGLLLGIQVVQRGLGIISTLILARLLAPEHFGIIALVTIALQFFELLVETGNQQYIVQKETLDDEDLNTAWSMDILIKSSIAVLVIASAPALARWFEEPLLTAALSVAALALPIRALKTPGMMRLAREINYRPLFRLTLWQKGLSFLTVISIAFIHPSHWAIIAGNLVSAAILAAGSYKVDHHRPRWTLSRFRQQWGFSQWLLMRGIVGFTRSQIDNLLVSRFFGTSQLGGYNLVREVSLLPALSAIIPMSEPLLAAIAEGKRSSEMLAYRIRISLALMITILTPVATFIMLYPELIIHVLLGTRWLEYASLLEPFGLFFFSFCLFALISNAIIAQGRVKFLFWFDLVSTVSILALLLWFATGSLSDMAWWRGWLAIATTIALLAALERQTGFNIGRLLFLALPTVLASAVSASLTTYLELPWETPLIDLLVRGTVFVLLAGALIVGLAFLLLRGTSEWYQLASMARSVPGLTFRRR
ncbi:oligosaccharide flippase family protein [Marinobacter bryozoorum]|uniref:oligosaccharide flippase family protein n=1 Tax=Marinobacter bryozoorum TaxID=256324 RepID=UPI002004519F|nr:oligosaccharide flippase family protein [Marinobacter bryozoorum]MCK7546195.1 oligosaccharide flippase family protein [Marinobacter bryozoorum]